MRSPDFRKHSFFKPVSEHGNFCGVFRPEIYCIFQSLRTAYGGSRVGSSCPESPLLLTARNEAVNRSALSYKDRAETLGAVELVRRNAEGVAILYGERQNACALNAVAVIKNAPSPQQRADLFHGLNYARFVIRGHNRAENRAVLNLFCYCFGADYAVIIGFYKAYFIAEFLHILCALYQSGMFYRRNYDMSALIPLRRASAF